MIDFAYFQKKITYNQQENQKLSEKETQLLMPNDSEDNKRLNRRIEFEVVKE